MNALTALQSAVRLIGSRQIRAMGLELIPSLIVNGTRTLGYHGLARMPNALASSSAIATSLRPGMQLLTAVLPTLSSACGFKVKGHLKRRCKDCYFVMRQERLYVICKTHPRHKQMSMKPPEKKTWILTHATQCPDRPW